MGNFEIFQRSFLRSIFIGSINWSQKVRYGWYLTAFKWIHIRFMLAMYLFLVLCILPLRHRTHAFCTSDMLPSCVQLRNTHTHYILLHLCESIHRQCLSEHERYIFTILFFGTNARVSIWIEFLGIFWH